MAVAQGTFEWLEARRTGTVFFAAGLTFVIVLLDWRIEPNISLGFLYILPLILVASVASRWQVTVYGLLCAILRELLSPFALQPGVLQRLILVSFVFVMTGLLAAEASENYRLLSRHWQSVESAEARLRGLIESGPLAILTVDREGRILLSNRAARHLLLAEGEPSEGRITDYFPALASPLANAASLLGRQIHMECYGTRANGERFQASIWFSVYEGGAGPEMAVVVWDSSENLRDRELASQEFLLDTSRVLVRAMAHEMRNLTGAAAQIHNGLAARAELKDDAYFKALGTLVRTMERLSPSTLRGEGSGTAVADVSAVLEELRIILGPSLEEEGVSLQWSAAGALPPVQGDRAALLQVFLNLSKNALRAMRGKDRRILTIESEVRDERVLIRFRDTGCGVRDPGVLFQPFDQRAEGTGLGLYLSRSLVTATGGDLRYEPQGEGSCFVLDLPIAGVRQR